MSPFTKWGLGGNAFSFDIFMGNYLTSSRLFTHIVVNNIWASGVLNKNGLFKCTIIGDKHSRENRNVATLNSTYQAKNQRNFD